MAVESTILKTIVGKKAETWRRTRMMNRYLRRAPKNLGMLLLSIWRTRSEGWRKSILMV
jgi:hypothetical protein